MAEKYEMGSYQPQSMRDRTMEFRAIAERLQKSQGIVAAADQENNQIGAAVCGVVGMNQVKMTLKQKSRFNEKAAEIGMGIHNTSTKLQKLSQLAKRTSMFDDPTDEINELTGIIKQDIQNLNLQISELQSIHPGSGVSKHSQYHLSTVVDNLRNRLKDAAKEFKEVLTMRSTSLKEQNTRRQQYFSTSSNGYSNVNQPLLGGRGALGSEKTAHSMFGGQAADAQGAISNRDVVQSSYEPFPASQMSKRARPLGTANLQQQMQLSYPQDSYQASRVEALQNVESTIIELGGIFQQLATMVAEQGELAIRIDENIEETFGNVESAQAQLLKYLGSISSSRWLILKAFFVLLIFIIIFVVFLA